MKQIQFQLTGCASYSTIPGNIVFLSNRHSSHLLKCSSLKKKPSDVRPDVVGEAGVRVHGADPSHGAGRRAVLRHVHVVSGPGEPRRLIGIKHRHSDRGAVLEGAAAQESRVHHRVEDLHREGVGAPAFIIHRLRGTREGLEMSVVWNLGPVREKVVLKQTFWSVNQLFMMISLPEGYKAVAPQNNLSNEVH